MPKIENYAGREQSFIKHIVLSEYLIRLFMIVGQHKRTFGYLDGFAGPWESNTDDLSDTSIGISIDKMLKAREDFRVRGWPIPKFKALYIEKKPESFAKLKSYLDDRQKDLPNGITLEAWKGDFIELQSKIIDYFDPKDFVFFFLDPTGWGSIKVEQLKPLIQRDNSELLINLMYDYINRFEEHARDVAKILDEEYPTDPQLRETFLVNHYRNSLTSIPSRYTHFQSAYVKIKYPEKERTFFHLVYLSRHPKGIITFMEESEKAEKDIQPVVRAKLKFEKNKDQASLFDLSDVKPKSLTPTIELYDLRKAWLNRLSLEPRKFTEEDFADLLSKTNCFPSDIQKVLGELIDEGLVENLDAKKKRPKNKINFKKKERLRRIKKG